MSGFRFHDIAMLNWLWLAPLPAILFYYAARKRRNALANFVDARLLPQLNPHVNGGNRVWKAIAITLTSVFLVVALARPAWNRLPQTVQQRGRDVVFLLDVSRSMLAEDLAPNRLERAKLAIMDAVDKLEGDRVALVVFSGAAVVKCPLTLDYGFFRMALDDVSPLSVTRGGTLIGDALRKVSGSVFDSKQSQYRDVVLITDGEDHESFPVEAAKSLGELQARLIAIGLGDENVGKRIPITGPDGAMTFLQFNGREVWSKLDAETLREMVNATPGGRYLNVSTGAIDLGDVYRQLIASAERQDIESRTIDRYEEKFQVFLAVGFLLLAVEMLLRERKPRRKRKRGAASPAGAALIAAALLAFPSGARAASIRSLVNEGNDAYRQEAYEKAIAAYDRAAEQDSDSAYAALNRANALYRSENFSEAIAAYELAVQRSLDRGRADLEAGGRYNLGNALYKQGEQLAEQNPQAGIDLLSKAVRSYKDAFRLNRGLTDAAHNVEVARRLIRQLREKAEQQQQQQDGEQNQDPNQERKSDLQKAADKQKELAEKSKQLDEERQRNRDTESRRRQQQQSEQLADRQEDLREQTEQMARDADPQTRRRLENAAESQRQAQEKLEQNQPEQAEERQRKAAEELQQAADSQRDRQQAGEQSEQQAEQQQPPPAQPSGQRQQAKNSAQQALTAADILDKEKRDKSARQALRRARIVPVEKDW